MLRWHTVVKTQRALTGPMTKHLCISKPKASIAMRKKYPKQNFPTLLIFAALALSRALATQDSPDSKERYQVLPATYLDAKLPIANFFLKTL